MTECIVLLDVFYNTRDGGYATADVRYRLPIPIAPYPGLRVSFGDHKPEQTFAEVSHITWDQDESELQLWLKSEDSDQVIRFGDDAAKAKQFLSRMASEGHKVSEVRFRNPKAELAAMGR